MWCIRKCNNVLRELELVLAVRWQLFCNNKSFVNVIIYKPKLIFTGSINHNYTMYCNICILPTVISVMNKNMFLKCLNAYFLASHAAKMLASTPHMLMNA